jgi:hypothetical protein
MIRLTGERVSATVDIFVILFLNAADFFGFCGVFYDIRAREGRRSALSRFNVPCGEWGWKMRGV